MRRRYRPFDATPPANAHFTRCPASMLDCRSRRFCPRPRSRHGPVRLHWSPQRHPGRSLPSGPTS
jgi:hypothetical protein